MRKLILMISILWSTSQLMATTFRVSIDSGTMKLTPLLITPIKDEMLLGGKSMSEIILSDLELSSEFELIQEGKDIQNISTRDLRRTGADFAFSGTIIKIGNEWKVHFELRDLYGDDELILQDTYDVTLKKIRPLSHHISNKIYEAIMKRPGFFDSKVAYVDVSGQPERFKLMIASIDGSDVHTLLNSHAPIMSPIWSPDRQYIAYVSFEHKRSEIYIIHVKTGKRELMTSYEGVNSAPSWSPDGEHLAVVLSKHGAPDIYIYDRGTKALQRITSDWHINTEPTWSEDGKHLYFTSDKSGRPQIYRYDFQTQQRELMTTRGRYNASPKLSSDGRYLFALHRTDRGFDIVRIGLFNDTWEVLTQDGQVESYDIAPNCKVILYATKIGAKKVLKILSLHGTIHKRFAGQSEIAKDPSWSTT